MLVFAHAVLALALAKSSFMGNPSHIDFETIPSGRALLISPINYEFWGTKHTIETGAKMNRSSPQLVTSSMYAVLKHAGCCVSYTSKTSLRVDGYVKDGKLYPLKKATYRCDTLAPSQMPKVHIPRLDF